MEGKGMRVLQVPSSLPPPLEPAYTIEGLTVEEVTTLHRLLYYHIAGPDDGPRGVLSRIRTALGTVVGLTKPLRTHSDYKILYLLK